MRFAVWIQLIDRRTSIWQMENEATRVLLPVLGDAGNHRGDAADVYPRVLRDLKRIHSHIAALAYPILD
jgi:phosphate:Na+ symporter